MKDAELLSHKAQVDAALGQGPRPLSSLSFIAIFAWADFFEYEFKMIDGNLCILAHQPGGCFCYLPPLGAALPDTTVKAVFDHMAATSQHKGINRIENIPEYLLSAFPASQYNTHAKSAEYVYAKRDLVALKGNAYKSQRHDCNHFTLHHPTCSFLAFSDDDLTACLRLYERWSANRAKRCQDSMYLAMLDDNRRVHERLMRHWRALGLVGRVVKTSQGIVAYTFGYPLDEVTFCIALEVADVNFPGAAAYIFNRFCADETLNNFVWVNTMDDFGMPKVARAKSAYHPAFLVPSYVVSNIFLPLNGGG